MPRSLRNYKRDVGDGFSNSIVCSAVYWIMRTFPEADITIARRDADKTLQPEPDHELVALIDRPNHAYSGTLMWMATVADFNVHGNAYWMKVRSGSGKLLQLWYVPQSLVEPHAHPDDFIDYYEYHVGTGPVVRVDPKDIVHFRYGIDPRNVRKGMSPLASLLREIFTDDEASNFSASLLTNMGVPGVIIAPESFTGSGQELQADAESVKQEFTARFGGDRRGEPMVMTAPTKVTTLSWSPASMDLKALRRLPEERVAAVIGIPAMVLGLGAGLDRSTFSNYAEAREAAYENNIIPSQRLLGEELRLQLLPDFEDEEELKRTFVKFDNSNVRALQDDQVKVTTRARMGVGGGIMTVAEGRELMGLPTDETHDVYLRPAALLTVPVADGAKPTTAPQAPPTTMGSTAREQAVPRYYATLPTEVFRALAEVGTELRTTRTLSLAEERTWQRTEVEVVGTGYDGAVRRGARLRSLGRLDGVLTLQVLPGAV